jgi:hypothetical protein
MNDDNGALAAIATGMAGLETVRDFLDQAMAANTSEEKIDRALTTIDGLIRYLEHLKHKADLDQMNRDSRNTF